MSKMPARITPLVNGQIYHIYNRGVEKRRIFEDRRGYTRFLQALMYYELQGPKPRFSNFIKYKLFEPNIANKIVDIICYCLMPNHFHLLVRQLRDGGISEFIGKLANSYTKYYNVKFDRVGPLLQGQFKAVLIESDEQFIHISRYIHLNPLTSFIVEDLDDYEWSSYKEYKNKLPNGICKKEDVLNFFKSIDDYQQFVLDQADYAQKLEIIKHQLIDGDI